MDPWSWEELDPSAGGLAEARLTLHYAAQPVAAVGQSLAPAAPDDSQQSLALSGPRSWLGAAVAGGSLRAGLDPVSLELRLCDGAGAPLASLLLAGRTLGEAMAFLRRELERRGQAAGGLALPGHPADFPHHPLADGARFPAGGEGPRSELARLYAGTHRVLADLGAGPSVPPRLWPHHFDLACTLAAGGGAVGLGVSPGDGASGRPYWYATPSPLPPEDRLPPLQGGGRWRREGWKGAELPLERLGRGAAAQREQVTAFFRSARAAAGG
jgi:hypothetical protein